MKNRLIISLSLVLLVVIVGLNFYAASPLAQFGLFEQFTSTSGNADLLTGAVVGATSVPGEIVEVLAGAPVTDFVEDFNDAINTSYFTPAVVGSAGIGFELINNEGSFNGSITSLTGSNGYRLYTAGAVSANNQSSTVYVNFTRTNQTYQAAGTISEIAGIEYYNSSADDYYSQCGLGHNGASFLLYLMNDSSSAPAATLPIGFPGLYLFGNLTFEYENTSNYMNCSFRLNNGNTPSVSAVKDSAIPPGTSVGLITYFLPQGPFAYNATANVTFEDFKYNGSADVNMAVPAVAPPVPVVVLPSFYDGVTLGTINTSFYDLGLDGMAVVENGGVYEFSNGTIVNRTGPSSSALVTVQNFSGGPSISLSTSVFMENLTNTYSSNGTLTSVWSHAKLGLQQSGSPIQVPYCSISMNTNGAQLRLYNTSNSPSENFTTAPALVGGNLSGTLRLTYDNLTNVVNCSFEGSEVTALYNLSNAGDTHKILFSSSIGIEGPGGSSDNYSLAVNVSFNNINFTITTFVDTTAPVVTIVNSSFSTLNTTPSVTFNFTDAYSTANCSLYLNGTFNVSNESSVNNTNTVLTVTSALTPADYNTTVTCVDGNSNSGTSNNITITVLAPGCGNGIQEFNLGEQCDDGNTANYDGCSSTCLDESFGGGGFAGCFSCPTNVNQNSCETPSSSNCNGGCAWESSGSFCKMADCMLGDGTNQTYCQTTLNATYGVLCNWDNPWCSPLGGDFFGNGCSDFTQTQCQDTPFCLWNSTDCTEDNNRNQAQGNPSCGIISTQDTCLNISGCSWSGSSCIGNSGGIECSDLNRSICSGSTFLSSCCTWASGACTTSYASTCYDEVQALPVGATSCNDYNVFTNQTLCNQIAGSPWYMACTWDNTTNHCNFNSAAFGGGDYSSFGEISSESACSAQGGNWKTEQWVNTVTSSIQSDSWCEFKTGFFNGAGSGNCDSSCWGCEFDLGVTNAATAESVCDGSSLGYCEFRSDSYAPNGYGWCNPKQDFIEAGGKSCDTECSACDFLTNPETQCQNSAKGCTFENDTTAPNGAGFCYGNSEKRCSTDCFSCYTQSDCSLIGKGDAGACSWDTNSYYCKPSGYSDEICFDGKDNDNDNLVDCLDPGCSTDKFCGGAELGESFGFDCPSFSSNTTCLTSGCVWLQDDFESTFGGANAGHCDFPGSQCWQYDRNSTTCNAASGCSYLTTSGGFCEINSSLEDTCFSVQNQTSCTAITGCGWNNFNTGGGFGDSGWCEPVPFAQCFGNSTRRQNQAACEVNMTVGAVSMQICSWAYDEYIGDTTCIPTMFTQTNATCGDGLPGLTELVSGLCEPDSFGGKCNNADGNQSWCEGTLNQSCTYFVDANANNNVTPGNNSGWCKSKGEAKSSGKMGNIEIEFIASDVDEVGINNNYDIEGLGLRDDFEMLGLGTRLYNKLNNSGICNNVPTYTTRALGVGQDNYTFFWYLDSDGDTTSGCTARDNSSVTGFEFSFKYAAGYGSSLTETKVSYQCIGGNWGPVPIPLISDKQKECNLIGGGMAGIDKKELFKFKTLFNKSKDLRLYATVGDSFVNTSYVNDTIGPSYYSLNSIDFKFEDCNNPGGDLDGDGITAANDPDCSNFNKFGFVPNEVGFQCSDLIDNDGDGKTDCSDEGCEFSYECGGTGIPIASAGDTKAPKIVWLQRDTFPDAAYVMYDTDEPANGTLEFYKNDSTCKTLNKTIRDAGIIDSFVPTYKMWHDAPIDSFAFNQEALGYSLTNATTYYFKTRVCDINGNCAVSACLNMTTKTTFASCSSCKSTFNFPFTPSGALVTDPLGYVRFTFELPDGTKQSLAGNAAAGTQLNYSTTKNFNLVIENPNATTQWKFKLINASVNGKVSTDIQNMSGTTDLKFNATSLGTYVGLGNTKCQQLINTFRPKKLEIGVPGNVSDLWQCDNALSSCTNKTSNATRVDYNITTNITSWQVPAEWGC